MTKRGLRTQSRRRGAAKTGGFTLIEVGLVIVLLGVVALLISEFYVSQLSLGRESRRVAGTVLDIQTVITAAVLREEAFGTWPNDPTTNEIDIASLVIDGFLTDATLPRNRYADCANCADYLIQGWDRDAVGVGIGDYTIDPTVADDLVVQVEVPTLSDAQAIAAQLPQGHVPGLAAAVAAGNVLAPPFVVEARVYPGGIASGEFVLVRNERRAVVFDAAPESLNVQGGDMQRVGRIAGSEQEPPCAPGQSSLSGDCQGPTDRHLTYGSAIVFEERVCAPGETPRTHNCRRICGPGESPATDDCQLPVLASSEPTILLREGLRLCATGEAPGTPPQCVQWEARFADQRFGDQLRTGGPALVLHGLGQRRCRPGQTLNCDPRPLCTPNMTKQPRTPCRPVGPAIHLISETRPPLSATAPVDWPKVLIEGDLELVNARDGRSGRVAMQESLIQLRCCVQNLTGTVSGGTASAFSCPLVTDPVMQNCMASLRRRDP